MYFVISSRKINMPKDATTYTSPQLLAPDNHSLMLVDQQMLVLITMRSHEVTQVLEAMTLLAKGARLFKVRTLLTTAHSETQKLVQQVQDAFPDQEPIERTGLNAFDEERIVTWVKEGGHKKLVITGLWTESCMTMTSLSALYAGYEVYIITDAAGSGSKETHDMAVLRMVQAGAIPLTVAQYLKEMQRDWARQETAKDLIALYEQHGGTYGAGLKYQQTLVANQVTPGSMAGSRVRPGFASSAPTNHHDTNSTRPSGTLPPGGYAGSA
jgi:nicotinamidase-related amidase